MSPALLYRCPRAQRVAVPQAQEQLRLRLRAHDGCDAQPHNEFQNLDLPHPSSPCTCLPACAAGDWLQGPYVYALYQYYGFDVKDIGRLFIAGFGSSMIFGTIVGSLADKQ